MKLWNIAVACWEAEKEDRPRTLELLKMVSAPGLLDNQRSMQLTTKPADVEIGWNDVTVQYPHVSTVRAETLPSC